MSFPAISRSTRRGRGETMLREELLWPQPVVLMYRAQHVTAGHAVPCHHVFIPPGMVMSGISGPRRSRGVARAPGDWAGARTPRGSWFVPFGRDLCLHGKV